MRIRSNQLIARVSGRSLRLVLLCATLVAPVLAAGSDPPNIERVVPPGQEELLGTMLGRGVALPGDCRLTGGGADGPIVTAEYACAGGKVAFELRYPDGAPIDALRTQHFAVVARSGTPPPGLTEALAALIRAHEESFEWTPLPGPHSPRSLFGPAAGACGIIAIGLAAQYLLGRRSAARARHECRGRTERFPLLPTLGLATGYLVTRLPFLTRLPVYVDESIHIHWTRPGGGNFSAEFSVGKWLPIKIMSLYMLLPFSPLYCARLASVSMGLATLLACVFINRELFSATEGLLAGVIYAILPFTILYDRLALADIYLTGFGAWSVFCSIAMIERRGLRWPLALGLSIDAAILSKPTGALCLATPVLVAVFLVRAGRRHAYLERALPALIGGMLLVTCLLWGGYGVDLVTSQSRLAGVGQLELVRANLETSSQWFIALLTPLVAFSTVVAAMGALAGAINKGRGEVFLIAVFLTSFMPYVLFATVWYPSYLLFTVVPIVLLLSRGLSACASAGWQLAKKVAPRARIPSSGVVLTSITMLFVVASTPRDLAMIVDPETAGLPPAEERYIRGWACGYGLPELSDFLREQARDGTINVVRFDLIGPANQGLDVYLSPSSSIHLYAVEPHRDNAGDEIARLAKLNRTIFISSPERELSQGILAFAYLGRAVRIWSSAASGSRSDLEAWEVLAP